MAKKSARKTKRVLDKQGFIFPLAIGALALLFFAWYFTRTNKVANNAMSARPKIEFVDDLNAASKDLDMQNPDSFNTDLNANTTDSSGL